MKSDFAFKAERTPKPSSSLQRAAEETPEDVSRSHSNIAGEDAYKFQSDGSVKDTVMQDAEEDAELSKLPRLPSIKHLQLDVDLQSPWHTADQYLSQKSPILLHSGSSTPLSISPIGTPIDISLFAPSPPMPLSIPPSPVMMASPPQTPTMQTNPIPINAFSSLSAANFASVKSLFASTPAPAAPLSSQPSTLAPSTFSRNVSLLAQDAPVVPVAPTVPNNFGFIETTFTAPAKKTHRRRPANVDKGSLYCHNCGSKNTPEWRRGPSGPATLCNACGLAYAKRLRQDDDIPQATTTQAAPIPVDSVAAAASGLALNGLNSCNCAQATTYGRCIHMEHQPQVQRPTPSQPQQGASRPMQMLKGMPVRINSHTFHNYTPPTPHPSLQQRNQGSPAMNQITFY